MQEECKEGWSAMPWLPSVRVSIIFQATDSEFSRLQTSGLWTCRLVQGSEKLRASLQAEMVGQHISAGDTGHACWNLVVILTLALVTLSNSPWINLLV